MNSKIFIDSNYFCAVENDKDALHQKAKDVSLILNDYPVVTSNFVLLETYTVISQRKGRQTAIKFGELIQSDPDLELINVNENLEDLTWEIFKSIKRKNVSYVDCSIIAAMKEYDIGRLLSFDSHFKQLQSRFGFKLLQ